MPSICQDIQPTLNSSLEHHPFLRTRDARACDLCFDSQREARVEKELEAQRQQHGSEIRSLLNAHDGALAEVICSHPPTQQCLMMSVRRVIDLLACL